MFSLSEAKQSFRFMSNNISLSLSLKRLIVLSKPILSSGHEWTVNPSSIFRSNAHQRSYQCSISLDLGNEPLSRTLLLIRGETVNSFFRTSISVNNISVFNLSINRDIIIREDSSFRIAQLSAFEEESSQYVR